MEAWKRTKTDKKEWSDFTNNAKKKKKKGINNKTQAPKWE